MTLATHDVLQSILGLAPTNQSYPRYSIDLSSLVTKGRISISNLLTFTITLQNVIALASGFFPPSAYSISIGLGSFSTGHPCFLMSVMSTQLCAHLLLMSAFVIKVFLLCVCMTSAVTTSCVLSWSISGMHILLFEKYTQPSMYSPWENLVLPLFLVRFWKS